MNRARKWHESQTTAGTFHCSASPEGGSVSLGEATGEAVYARFAGQGWGWGSAPPRRPHRRLFVWRRAGLGGPIGLTLATGDAKSAAIRLEATHAINAHRGDRSGGNVARPSRQPSHSNAVVRGH